MGHKLIKSVAASEVAKWCGLELKGENYVIKQVDSLNNIGDGVLCFSKSTPDSCINGKGILISKKSSEDKAKCILVSENPRLAYAKVLIEIERRVGFIRPDGQPQIDPTAVVSPLASIGSGVVIGPRTVVLPFAYIGAGTIIGADCVIKTGAVIGQDGFGFERDENNMPIRLVHLGFVKIGDSVEIGSLTTVCRGTINDTIIDDHAKIDDHVHIAHNVHVCKGAMIVACAEVSGGVVVGDEAWIGPNSTVIQQKIIGKRALIGIGSNVLKDIPDDAVYAGNPARELKPK